MKITGSNHLTLENIFRVASVEKGLDLVGLVDGACRGVLRDLQELAGAGRLESLAGGGLRFGEIVLFPGSEVEIAHSETGRAAHFVAFFPDLAAVADYVRELWPSLTNPNLSTQRLRMSGDDWLELVAATGGVALAAHAFTPHKGVYGNCVSRLEQMFRKPELISCLELGLSANTEMALMVKDTHAYPFISNSDAHSLGTIGREFTVYDLPRLSFSEWKGALQENGRGIVANHGLQPLLGKYYRSFCPRCQWLAREDEPVWECPHCEGSLVLGVWDRLRQIQDWWGQLPARPPYISHVPLMMLSGVGPKTYARLIKGLGTEIEILYKVSLEAIARLAGPSLARQIEAMRQGRLSIIPGGGGKYGQAAKM